MRTFDYSFLKEDALSSRLLNLTDYIHEIKNEAQSKKILNPVLFTELVKLAKVQSVKGSNAIEGIVTTDKRIAAIVNQNAAPLNHDEQEIAGYRDALSLIHQNFAQLSFSEQDILALHGVLLTPSGTPWRGQYKDRDNLILEIDNQGNRTVRYRPTSAQETPEAMRQLILAYLAARQDDSINQLLLIPCVILDFLCIHPFQDGNGRMSRLLSLLLMYQTHYDVGKYISFEQQINLEKNRYYDALKRSSEHWDTGHNNYAYFIENFLHTLYRCYAELAQRMATVEVKKIKKEARIRSVISASLLPLSKQEILAIVPDISASTVERVLAAMLVEGSIVKIGSFKDAKYRRKNG